MSLTAQQMGACILTLELRGLGRKGGIKFQDFIHEHNHYLTLYDDLKRELINELQLSHKIETHIKGTCISYINKLKYNSDASLK